MLKEQLLAFAMKALMRGHELKENIKKSLKSAPVRNYVKSLKEVAIWSIENRSKVKSQKQARAKSRKSSIRQANQIHSPRAEIILHRLKKDNLSLVKSGDEVNGKKSLAYLIWALGHAENAELDQGISVHDVSALLYKANKINLYPINISRVVHSNDKLVRQVSQEQRTKTYLLTEAGKNIFNKIYM